jgi:hypothetical protein
LGGQGNSSCKHKVSRENLHALQVDLPLFSGRLMLEELISHLKQAKKTHAPDLLQIFLQTFQAFGNFASHDQDGDKTDLTNDIAEPIYKLYCQALILYANWQKEPQREQGNTE